MARKIFSIARPSVPFSMGAGEMMQLTENLVRILVQQMANEFQSAYLYLGMAAYLERTPFGGFARWMRRQAAEEVRHGDRIFSYLVDRDAPVELYPLGKAQCSYTSPLEAFRAALDHEQRVTRWIRDIYELALLEKDYETMEFANWFLKEQVEEEKQTRDWVERLAFAGEDRGTLLALDCRAGQER
ncbi:MAG: ferritin [Puniceicoccales bacterium]|jgi:ferritin|nr:ferritin [Puniceicoccales bacterium]